MATILVVDDEPALTHILSVLLRKNGHEPIVCATGAAAIDTYPRVSADVVLLDYALPDIPGTRVFERLRKLDPNVMCIYMTAYGSIRSAVDAMKGGAVDYLAKPFDNSEVLLLINRAVEMRRLTREVDELRGELQIRYGFDDLVGISSPMRELFRQLSKVVNVDATVLILGESGTGKELVARSIHRQSSRASGPFVAVNCGAIPATLVESEFFGHERGAFTDAKDAHPGKFEQASKGVLFLDEIGELPISAQAKLLRVLQDHEVTRVGGKRPIRVDVRIVAATNVNLESAVQRGTFREDLYWRLNVLALKVPPLRERREDVSLLIDALLRGINTELHGKVQRLTPDALQCLQAHAWPGNVRELENVLRRAAVFCENHVITIGDLPVHVRSSTVAREADDDPEQSLSTAVNTATTRVERELIRSRLVEHGGNRTATAQSLGINRKTLFKKMKDYGISSDEEDGNGAAE